MEAALHNLFIKEPKDEPSEDSAVYEMQPSLAAEIGGLFEYVGYDVTVQQNDEGHLVLVDAHPTPEKTVHKPQLAEEFYHEHG